jgi:hypothetical protein
MTKKKLPEMLFWIGFTCLNLGLIVLLISVERYPQREGFLGWLLIALGVGIWILAFVSTYLIHPKPSKPSDGNASPQTFPSRRIALVEIGIYWVILFTSFVGLVFMYRLDEIGLATDSRYYASVASRPLTSLEFWLAERPVGLPMLFKFVGITAETIANRSYLSAAHRLTQLQLVFSLLSFAFLGLAFTRLLKNQFLRVAAFALIMALGLGIDVSLWNKALLTESFATSAFVFLIGLWIIGIELWDRWGDVRKIIKIMYLISLLSITLFYALLRDTHLYLLLCLSFVIFFSMIFIANRKRSQGLILVGYGAFLVGIFFLQNFSASQGNRWLGPFSHVLYLRLLREDRSTAILLESGMPQNNKADEFFEGRRRDFERMLAEDASGQPILDWMLQDGRRIYYQYLLMNPHYTFGKPIEDLDKLISPDSTEYRARLYEEPGWIEAVRRFLYPQSLTLVAFWLVGLAIGTGWLGFHKAIDNRFIVPCFLLVTSIPMMLIVWHGDAIEVERHAQQLHLQIRLGLWMASFLLIDGFLSKRSMTNIPTVEYAE